MFLPLCSLPMPLLSLARVEKEFGSGGRALDKGLKRFKDIHLMCSQWRSHPMVDSFVSGGLDRALRLWDMRTRQVQQLFEGYAYATAFSPDGIILASGALSPDPRRLLVQQADAYTPVRLQDANTGKLLRELKAHKGLVYSIAFSPDGNTLASGSEDKVIHLWDTHSGENLNTFEGHTAEISSVEFSPNGKHAC